MAITGTGHYICQNKFLLDEMAVWIDVLFCFLSCHDLDGVRDVNRHHLEIRQLPDGVCLCNRLLLAIFGSKSGI